MNHWTSRYDTLLVLDTIEDRLSIPSRELFAFATAIGNGDNSRTLLFLPGKNVEALAASLAEETGLATVLCEHEQLYRPNPELLRLLLLETMAEFEPKLVCFLHNMRNCQTASALAVSLRAASITAVESFTAHEDGATYQRSIANGKLLQNIRPVTAITIVTILPGAFSLPDKASSRSGIGRLYRREYPQVPCVCMPLDVRRETESGARLEDADVVIAAGRGLATKEQLALLEEVARLFPNAAVAASRPLCDRKWLPFSQQVGVTGKTIAPRLYMACGISGSQQHLAGIKGAQCIIAINRDPQAAIFSVADYIVVDDLHAFLPLLSAKQGERSNHE